MRQVVVKNLSAPRVLPVAAFYCAAFLCRLRGLMFHRPLSADEGLLLVGNKDSRLDAAIHMFGVWSDLAIVWINSAGVVVDVRLARPWRPIYVPRSPACYILEMTPARLRDFRIGDEVRFEEV